MERGQIQLEPHEHVCTNCGMSITHEDLSESCWQFINSAESACKALDTMEN